jgi:hypothetical protein
MIISGDTRATQSLIAVEEVTRQGQHEAPALQASSLEQLLFTI